jgi:AcrR family transcriptional regulator
MSATSSRLTKQARREQLLDAALEIVRTHGADALTLVTLAEAAGVSRPIAYDHFGTRAGLLVALYRRLEQQHRAAVSDALHSAAPDVTVIAHVMSAAYFACATDMPEFGALSAALKGDPEMEAAQHELLDAYTTEMVTALVPYTDIPVEGLRLRCVGLLGAAEAIATELVHGRTTSDTAVDALADLIVRGLTTGTAGSCP